MRLGIGIRRRRLRRRKRPPSRYLDRPETNRRIQHRKRRQDPAGKGDDQRSGDDERNTKHGRDETLRTRAQDARRQCPRGITDSGVREVWGAWGSWTAKVDNSPSYACRHLLPARGEKAKIETACSTLSPPAGRGQGEGRFPNMREFFGPATAIPPPPAPAGSRAHPCPSSKSWSPDHGHLKPRSSTRCRDRRCRRFRRRNG